MRWFRNYQIKSTKSFSESLSKHRYNNYYFLLFILFNLIIFWLAIKRPPIGSSGVTAYYRLTSK